MRLRDFEGGINKFNKLIPDTVTEILFTDEIKPAEAEIIDVDADGDGGVVAWAENDGSVIKVSTQVKGMKVKAAKNSGDMFYSKQNLTNIDLSMLDTSNVTNMCSMSRDCRGLTALDLSPLNTQNITDMSYMFNSCRGLTALDLSPLDTQNVASMEDMFNGCSGLTALDLSSFDTQKVTSISDMFYWCNSLTILTTGPNFKFVGTNYNLSGTWQNTAGETFTAGNFPSNVADTYTKISN